MDYELEFESLGQFEEDQPSYGDKWHFEDYKVWQEAHKLAINVYQTTKTFPKTEQYGLISQLNRAAMSVPANIAEGRHRYSAKEFLRHLVISRGSLAEVRYFLIFARDLNFIDTQLSQSLLQGTSTVGKLINRTIAGVRKNMDNPRPK